jgi:hypothetical protein
MALNAAEVVFSNVSFTRLLPSISVFFYRSSWYTTDMKRKDRDLEEVRRRLAGFCSRSSTIKNELLPKKQEDGDSKNTGT